MSIVKDSLKEIAEQLSDELIRDEVISRVNVRHKVEAGITDADAGGDVPLVDVFAEFREEKHWRRQSGQIRPGRRTLRSTLQSRDSAVCAC
jgi:hypothetical protein